ncbi:uncharacterized protein LOC132744392 [Ruditapes philippinarum]|uniref:uncharacterized protein LOC132744392 n=1 Tax=Ruditapes philippinarum TaxID=129788 RepID=UPI00295A9083|nr:uncharacterized protein LOC132744392 [Ruditapes philippinarum]
MADGNCGKGYYYDAPTGKCRDYGWLCDTPSLYSHSCDKLCPEYGAKKHVTSQPPGQDNRWKLNMPGLVIIVCAVLILVSLLYLLWMMVSKGSFVISLKPSVTESNHTLSKLKNVMVGFSWK